MACVVLFQARMPLVITQACVGVCDTGCVDVCPVDCIAGPVSLDTLRQAPHAQRPTRFPTVQLFIDPAECIDCGACVPECPEDAIHPADTYPEDARRNAVFWSGRQPGVAR